MSLHKKGKYQEQSKCNIVMVILLLVVLIIGFLGSVVFLQNRNSEWTLQGTTESEVIPYDTKSQEITQTEMLTTSIMEIQTESNYEISYLTQADLSAMRERDLIEFYENMLSISAEKELTIQEMEIIANNYFYIWKSCSAVEFKEFSQKSYQVFCNIYEQALKGQINLDQIGYYWSQIPVPEILCKYYSSSNFAVPENISFLALDSLKDDDVILIAETFFSNPVMKTNTDIPRSLILRNCDQVITDKSWQHFENLSQDTSPNTSLSSVEFTSMFYHSLIGTTLNEESVRKIANIAENILENPYYDLKTKYMYFCNAFYDGSKKEYTDATIAFRTVDSLLILAKNADEEIREQLFELVDLLWDTTIADALRDILTENEQCVRKNYVLR